MKQLFLTTICIAALAACTNNTSEEAASPESQIETSITVQDSKPSYKYERPLPASDEALEALNEAYKDLSSFIWLNEADRTETVFRSLVAKTEAAFPQDIYLQAGAKNNLGGALIILGRPDEALPMLEDALEMVSALPNDKAVNQDARYRLLSNLAEAHLRLDNTTKAKELFDSALVLGMPFSQAIPEQIDSGIRFMMVIPRWEDQYKKDPNSVLVKAGITPSKEARDAAIAKYHEVVRLLATGNPEIIMREANNYYDLMLRAHHPRSRFIYSAHGNIGSLTALFVPDGDYEPYFDLGLETGAKFGYETRFDIENITIGLVNTASQYLDRNRIEKAEFYLREAQNRIENNLPRTNPARITLYNHLLRLTTSRGEYDEALYYAKEIHDIAQLRGPEAQFDYFQLRSRYANLLSFRSEFDKADDVFLDIIKEAESTGDDDNVHLFYVGSTYTINLLSQGRYLEAVSVGENLVEKILKSGAVNQRALATIYGVMANSYSAMGQHEKALFYVNKSFEIGKEANGNMPILFAEFELNKIGVHHNAGDFEAAQSFTDAALDRRKDIEPIPASIPKLRTWQARLHERADRNDAALNEYMWLDNHYTQKESGADKINHRATKFSLQRLRAKESSVEAAKALEAIQPLLLTVDQDRDNLQNIFNNTQAANRAYETLYEASLDIAFSAKDPEEALHMYQRLMSHGVGYISRQVKNRALTEDPKLQAKYKELDLLKAQLSAQKVNNFKYAGLDAEKLKKTNLKIERFSEKVAGLEGSLKSSLDKMSRFEAYIPLADIQANLGEEEAVLIITDTVYGLYVMAVTQDSTVLNHTPLEYRDLRRLIEPLRESLFVGADNRLKPFDKGTAKNLSQFVFSDEIVQALKSKKTLKTLTGNQFSKLPLSLLIWPEGDDFFNAKFTQQTLTSFDLEAKASRKNKTKGLLAVGAPILKKEQSTEEVLMAENTATSNLSEGLSSLGVDPRQYILRGSAGVKDVSELPPLANALEEMQSVATALDFKTETILSGMNAKEERVKSLNLKDYSIILMATHGLVSGELNKASEPALVIGLPENETSDDGLLTMSEIMNLDMNAELVILSACNSASGGQANAQGLTGLASAFLYAGAENLLVSHWPVRDDAAAFLTVNTVKNAQAGMSKAEALQKAIEDLRENKDIPNADHPAIWAPFVLVGQ